MRDLGSQKVDLTQAGLDGVVLIGRELQLGEPPAALLAEQVSHRRAAFEVAHQHGGDLVLGTSAGAHQLRASGGQAAQHAGLFVADPDARDEISGEQFGQGARVELVVFDLGVADRTDLHRVGDHHLGDERLEDPGDL